MHLVSIVILADAQLRWLKEIDEYNATASSFFRIFCFYYCFNILKIILIEGKQSIVFYFFPIIEICIDLEKIFESATLGIFIRITAIYPSLINWIAWIENLSFGDQIRPRYCRKIRQLFRLHSAWKGRKVRKNKDNWMEYYG